MKKTFKLEKLPLETLINLFIQLYDNGVDYVDLSADNSDPNQDKLIVITKEGYINPKYYNEEGLNNFEITEDDDDDDNNEEESVRKPSSIEARKLSDDDIEKLL